MDSPIHRYSGACPAVKSLKNSGFFFFISSAHFLLFSKILSCVCCRYLRTALVASGFSDAILSFKTGVAEQYRMLAGDLNKFNRGVVDEVNAELRRKGDADNVEALKRPAIRGTAWGNRKDMTRLAKCYTIENTRSAAGKLPSLGCGQTRLKC